MLRVKIALEILAAVAIINSMRLSKWCFDPSAVFLPMRSLKSGRVPIRSLHPSDPGSNARQSVDATYCKTDADCESQSRLDTDLGNMGLAWPDLSPLKLIFSSPPIGHGRSSPASDWRTLRSLCVSPHLVYSWYPGPVNKKKYSNNLFPAKKKCLPNLDMWGTIITKRVKYVNTDKCFTSHIRLRFTYFSANLLISQDS